MVKKAWEKVKENGNLKVIGWLIAVILLLVNIALGAAAYAYRMDVTTMRQCINDLTKDNKLRDTERQQNKQDIAVINTQYEYIKEQLEDIKEAIK